MLPDHPSPLSFRQRGTPDDHLYHNMYVCTRLAKLKHWTCDIEEYLMVFLPINLHCSMPSQKKEKNFVIVICISMGVEKLKSLRVIPWILLVLSEAEQAYMPKILTSLELSIQDDRLISVFVLFNQQSTWFSPMWRKSWLHKIQIWKTQGCVQLMLIQLRHNLTDHNFL